MKYRPEIDGLRAIAVLPVILFHAGFSLFSGGYVGVDIFFVISGYLITTIILSELQKGSFSLYRFYVRRARRILPVLASVILSCLPFAWWLMDPYELKELGQSIVATSVFLSNVFFWLKTGYFDTAAELKPLLHTWTLAVEEQFYVIVPLILMAGWRWFRALLVPLLGVIFLISLGWAHWGSEAQPSATFYLLHTRAWELLIGSFLAFYLYQRPQPIPPNLALSSLGLLLIVIAIFGFDSSTPFPSLYTLLPTLGTALIILYANSSGPIFHVLSSRPLVAIGLLSYSAYLWHQPLIAFTQIYLLDHLQLSHGVFIVVATLTLSWLSKRYIEDYFRFSFLKGRDTLYLILLAAVFTVLAAFGYAAHKNLGFPERSPLGMQLAQNFGLSEACNGELLDSLRCRSGKEPDTLVWGDSFAMHSAQAFALTTDAGVQQATLSACPPIVGYPNAARRASISCEDFNAAIFDSLVGANSIADYKTVAMSSTFGHLVNDTYLNDFENQVEELIEHGYQVVIVGPPPTYSGLVNCIKRADRNKTSVQSCQFAIEAADQSTRHVNSLLKELSHRQPIVFVDLHESFCKSGMCQLVSGETILYRDDIHLANDSKEVIAELIREASAQLK